MPDPAAAVVVPRILCDTRVFTADVEASAGALWKLAESGRQLDANLIHLPARERVDTHTEPDLDVLLFVLTGGGTLDGPGGPQPLAEATLLWLPRGSTRNVTAGETGLSYLTVHRRRPGLQIQNRAQTPAEATATPPAAVTPPATITTPAQATGINLG